MSKHFDMIQWVKSEGGDLRRTKVVVYAPDYRGLHATVDIKPRQEILSIPISLAISSENLMTSELGRKLKPFLAFDPKWAMYIFPLIYILEELKNANSHHKQWLQILPKTASDHPMRFSAEERKWLAGSSTLGISLTALLYS